MFYSFDFYFDASRQSLRQAGLIKAKFPLKQLTAADEHSELSLTRLTFFNEPEISFYIHVTISNFIRKNKIKKNSLEMFKKQQSQLEPSNRPRS